MAQVWHCQDSVRLDLVRMVTKLPIDNLEVNVYIGDEETNLYNFKGEKICQALH